MKPLFVLIGAILFSTSSFSTTLMSTTSKGGNAVNCQNFGQIRICQYTPQVSIRTDLIRDRIENNTIYFSKDSIAVTILANDIDGTITNTTYLVNGQKLHSSQTIVTQWGTEITAIVTDNNGLTTEHTRTVSPPNLAICQEFGQPFISLCEDDF